MRVIRREIYQCSRRRIEKIKPSGVLADRLVKGMATWQLAAYVSACHAHKYQAIDNKYMAKEARENARAAAWKLAARQAVCVLIEMRRVRGGGNAASSALSANRGDHIAKYGRRVSAVGTLDARRGAWK